MKKILRLVVLVVLVRLEGWRGAVSGKSRYLDNLQATRTTQCEVCTLQLMLILGLRPELSWCTVQVSAIDKDVCG